MHTLFQLLLTVSIYTLNIRCMDWSYEPDTGPLNWPKMFPEYCSGKSQSPINIATSTIKSAEKQPVHFVNYKAPILSPKLTNNGHSAQVSGAKVTSYVTTNFENSPQTYDFAYFHFHWGSNSSLGSEHAIDGQHYPMEMHLLHTNRNYPESTQYLNHSLGIAVVGIFFKISPTDNLALKPLTDNLDKIVNASTQIDLPANSIVLSKFLPTDLLMYAYSGSLTTPLCNEVVTWLMLANPVPVSESQMKKFRTLKDSRSQSLVNNFRPEQALNGRRISNCKGKLQRCG